MFVPILPGTTARVRLFACLGAAVGIALAGGKLEQRLPARRSDPTERLG